MRTALIIAATLSFIAAAPAFATEPTPAAAAPTVAPTATVNSTAAVNTAVEEATISITNDTAAETGAELPQVVTGGIPGLTDIEPAAGGDAKEEDKGAAE